MKLVVYKSELFICFYLVINVFKLSQHKTMDLLCDQNKHRVPDNFKFDYFSIQLNMANKNGTTLK